MRHVTLGALIAIVALLAMPLAGRAEDDALLKQYTAVGAARARAELALQRARTLVDENRSGWAGGWQLAELARGKTYRVLETAIAREESRDENVRRTTFLDSLHDRLNSLHDETDAFAAKRRIELDNTYRMAGETIEKCSRVMEALTAMETQWKESGMDLATLQAAYESLAKRAGEAGENAQGAITALKERQTNLDADLEAAKRFVAEQK